MHDDLENATTSSHDPPLIMKLDFIELDSSILYILVSIDPILPLIRKNTLLSLSLHNVALNCQMIT